MAFTTCPCCGKTKSFKRSEKDIKVVYGQTTVTAKLPVQYCSNCGSTFDLDSNADEIRKEAFITARQKSVCNGLEKLEEKISFAELERCFSLAPRTLSKWKNAAKAPSASAAALVNLLNVFPWLAYVGMSNYDSVEAYKIAAAAVLQKANENPENFILPVSNGKYSGVVLMHTNTVYNENYTGAVRIESKYIENVKSSTIQYKG